MKRMDLIGQTFGMLTVIDLSEKTDAAIVTIAKREVRNFFI